MRVRIVLVYCLLCAPVAFATVMESDSYRMSADSVNIGGAFGESDSYRMEDTVGEIATGDSGSASYRLHAGYQQMHGSMISMTPGADISLTPLSLTQHSAVGSTTWTIVTDDMAGYTLSVASSSIPALVDGGTGESFADYEENVSGTPETWNVSSAYEFGFSARGTNVSSGIWGTDIDCINTADVPSATLKWRGFDGVTSIVLASSLVRTDIVGIPTYMCVATEQDNVFAPSGTYTATITATAITN